MNFELINEADYASLPSQPNFKFMALENICRNNMTKLMQNSSSETFDNRVRSQYMTVVSSAAEALGIHGVPRYNSSPSNSSFEDLDYFLNVLVGVKTKIRLLDSPVIEPYSVHLAKRTKALIEVELDKLRTALNRSDLNESKKDRLLAIIDDFRTELYKERLQLKIAMSTLCLLAAGLGGTTSFLADAPQAIETITTLIGVDKEYEEAEVLRLTEPAKLKALPSPDKAA